MKTQFTKGKWKVNFDKIFHNNIVYTDGEYNESKQVQRKKCICAFSDIRGDLFTRLTQEEAEANAKLITTSQEMFYQWVLVANCEGWLYAFNIVKKVTGTDYKYGSDEFDELVKEATSYLKETK